MIGNILALNVPDFRLNLLIDFEKFARIYLDGCRYLERVGYPITSLEEGWKSALEELYEDIYYDFDIYQHGDLACYLYLVWIKNDVKAWNQGFELYKAAVEKIKQKEGGVDE